MKTVPTLGELPLWKQPLTIAVQDLPIENRGISVDEYKSMAAEYVKGPDHTVRLVVLDEVRKSKIIETHDNRKITALYDNVACNTYNRTGTALSRETVKQIFKSAKCRFRERFRKAIEKNLDEQQTEEFLLTWDYYPFMRFFRETTVQYEKKIRQKGPDVVITGSTLSEEQQKSLNRKGNKRKNKTIKVEPPTEYGDYEYLVNQVRQMHPLQHNISIKQEPNDFLQDYHQVQPEQKTNMRLQEYEPMDLSQQHQQFLESHGIHQEYQPQEPQAIRMNHLHHPEQKVHASMAQLHNETEQTEQNMDPDLQEHHPIDLHVHEEPEVQNNQTPVRRSARVMQQKKTDIQPILSHDYRLYGPVRKSTRKPQRRGRPYMSTLNLNAAHLDVLGNQLAGIETDFDDFSIDMKQIAKRVHGIIETQPENAELLGRALNETVTAFFNKPTSLGNLFGYLAKRNAHL